ncbi:LOW QUALITY PROTEIN: protein dispatched homolog 3-like [Dendronephthya gigantea]|uniref:LOW QUALITY PROTEIN: protein dispatched homolog 3-like n=1 Tax=Dendronephthya gigantea TaxID=151771 RepID=UPI00106A930D|nr:LOW QUALITY PROTEIN: protein dispatched homolog 3-like [Dendronephthya gigantea]
MSFARNAYRRLPTAKYGCAETDGDFGMEQINQNDEEDEDLAGYSLDFAEPKDNFVGQIKRSCEFTRRKLMAVLHIVLKFAFGKWPVALSILICYICLTIALTAIALTGKYHEFRKDLSLNSFMVPDIKVSNDFAAFNAAKNQEQSYHSTSFATFMKRKLCTGNGINPSPKEDHKRLKRSTPSDLQIRPSGTLDLVYVAKDGDNIFTAERLQEIHNIETTLMTHANYDKHCLVLPPSMEKDKTLGKYGKCVPLKSLTRFFFGPENKFKFDETNDAKSWIDKTIHFLRSKEYFYSFVSNDYSKKNVSKILRAQILFGKPVEGIENTAKAQKDEYKRYITTYVSTLEKLNNNNQVTILYGGGDLFDYLVNHALLDDLRLAAISLGLIILLLLILTFSWWLTFMAVFSIVSSIAFAYFFYRVVFGIQYMGILNGVSLFVIIGIGVDDIFVFINTFRQAVDNKDVGNRIMHTIYVAGKATFFTSFTTAAAFGANALSPIPAIHDFGVFMAILVASCWVSVLFIMSPSLTLWHSGIEHLESAMCNKALSAIGIRRSERLRLPDDIRQFLSGIASTESSGHEVESIPLVTHSNNDEVNNDDDGNDGNDDGNDLKMMMMNHCLYLMMNQLQHPVTMIETLLVRLQSILYHYLAMPVIKGRIVIFCVYLFVLIGSALLMSKIKVSTEQPKFFKADSNLQRWLELPDVSLKQKNDQMIKDIELIEKRLSHVKSTVTPSTEKTRIHTRRVIRTSERTTRHPEFIPSTKPWLPSTWFRSTKSPSTWKPATKSTTTRFKRPTTEPRKPSTHITTVATESTTEKERSTTEKDRTTSTVYETKERPSTIRIPTKDSEERTTPGLVTTLPTNSSNSQGCTPSSCKNYGKCNNVTGKCDCYFPYTGDTCSHYCPVKTVKGKCCFLPFKYKGKMQQGCLIDKNTGKPWCLVKPVYKKKEDREDCNTTVSDDCHFRTNTPNKSCCSIPFTYNNIEYYTCIQEDGWDGKYCGIQRHISSRSELVRCATSLCPPNACKPVKAPSNKATALVYLVFGIEGVDKTSVDLRHVLKQTEGKVLYDEAFSKDISCDTERMLKAACKICKTFSSNRKLVRSKNDSECFPTSVAKVLMQRYPHDCNDLPLPTHNTVFKKSTLVVKENTERRYEVRWLAMAFLSTTETLSSYSSQHKDYILWEKQLEDVLFQNDIPHSWKSGFQTSETWVKMFSGMIVVNSAIYGIAVSLLLCLAAVIIFTGHALLFIILLLTILGVLLMVTAIFYLTGWQIGGVEAISLSILVGTSVDYSFHLVEGYILAGNAVSSDLNNKHARQWRTKAAMSHIGMSIISSALTTILAAIPLCLTQIQLFAKFGLIVTINTGISLLYTLTVTIAMLSIFGPARFRASFRACVVGFIVVLALGGLGVLVLYLMSTKGSYCIQSPSGTPLFDC